MNTPDMAFGQYLREMRRARGWTQFDLAAEVGVQRWTVGRWEIGATVPGPRSVLRLAVCLDADLGELCARVGVAP